ncbi:MAG: phage tail tube protein [Novosphingobium meiothermophilum]
MAYELGSLWRIHVGDGATPEVFSALGGEGSFEWQRSSDSIDWSTKDSAIYKPMTYGAHSIMFNVSGKVELPDAALERIFAVQKSTVKECSIKIMKGAVTKYAGTVAIGNFSASAADGQPVTYSFNMVAADVPTTDALGAIA